VLLVGDRPLRGTDVDCRDGCGRSLGTLAGTHFPWVGWLKFFRIDWVFRVVGGCVGVSVSSLIDP
jgi:hypothetical protein